MGMEDELWTIYEMLVPDADETIGVIDSCWVLVVGGDAEFGVLRRDEKSTSQLRCSLAPSSLIQTEISPSATNPQQ